MWSSGMKGIGRDEVAVPAHRVVERLAGRRGSRVRDSRGTTVRSKSRSRESESIARRDRGETPSSDRSQSHGAGTAESPSRPRYRECRGCHAPVRIARRGRAIESSLRCDRRCAPAGLERKTPARVGLRDPATESRLDSESRTGPWPASSRVARALMFASCSPPATTRRGYLRAPASRKPRVVAVMNKDSALELFALEDRPAAAGDLIAFVRSLEREFDRRQALTLDHSIVQIRLDRQQAESSVTFGLQRQVGRIHQVEIVEVPQFRLDDAPCSEERVLRSSTCRHSVHAHHRQSITPSGHPAQTESGRVGRPVPGARAAWSAGRR